MKLTEIFKEYFLIKLNLWSGILIVVVLIRHFTKPDTSILFLLGFISFMIITALISGLIDYNFYEKQAPKIVLELLNKSPLSDFIKQGFSIDDDNTLNGQINDFQVTLAPLATINRKNTLVILIPLKLQEGLEEYFTNFDNLFKFRISENTLIAEATINSYDKNYDFAKLNTILTETIKNLKNKNIQPVELTKDD